jgi:DNA-binding XRE family transcriptional regulator
MQKSEAQRWLGGIINSAAGRLGGQSSLARSLGRSRNTIAAWKSGANDPSWLDFLTICELAGPEALNDRPAGFPFGAALGVPEGVGAGIFQQHELRLSALELRLIELQAPQYSGSALESDVREIARKISEMTNRAGEEKSISQKSA